MTSFDLEYDQNYLRKYEIFKAIFVKYMKEKFRSVVRINFKLGNNGGNFHMAFHYIFYAI